MGRGKSTQTFRSELKRTFNRAIRVRRQYGCASKMEDHQARAEALFGTMVVVLDSRSALIDTQLLNVSIEWKSLRCNGDDATRTPDAKDVGSFSGFNSKTIDCIIGWVKLGTIGTERTGIGDYRRE